MEEGRRLAETIRRGGRLDLPGGRVRGRPADPAGGGTLPGPVVAGERGTNATFRFGDVAILKVYARPEPGIHPEVEVGLHLGARLRFPGVAPLLGWAEREADGAAVAVLHGIVPGGETAWDRFRGRFATGSAPEPGEAARIGALTADLHRALADHRGDDAFRLEPVTARWRDGFRRSATELLDRVLPFLPELPGEEIRQRLLATPEPAGPAPVQRVHGDYHLEQVLVAPAGLFVLDFEGEPDRPLASRRGKHPPEKDLAGLLRSFDYAARSADAPEEAHREPAEEFLRGYGEAGGRWDSGWLELFLLEKALYEAGYEAAHRPEWLPIPLAGLRALLAATK